MQYSLTRIRRGPEFPDFINHEIACNQKHPLSFKLNINNSSILLRYRKTRWQRIGENGVVKRSKLFCWIEIEEKNVGAVLLEVFQVDSFIGDYDFWETMDRDSIEDSHLADVLCTQWADISISISDFGPIIEFRSAWMHPQYAHSAIWAVAAKLLISRHFKQYSLLVMKAFPLEYVDNVPDGANCIVGLRQRQAAMTRHYMKLFDVMPMLGPPGVDGWLFGPASRLSGIIPLPEYKPHSFFEEFSKNLPI